MQSFGWKRKAGLSKPRPPVFTEDNVEETHGTEDTDVNWLTATKRPKVTSDLKTRPIIIVLYVFNVFFCI